MTAQESLGGTEDEQSRHNVTVGMSSGDPPRILEWHRRRELGETPLLTKRAYMDISHPGIKKEKEKNSQKGKKKRKKKEFTEIYYVVL